MEIFKLFGSIFIDDKDASQKITDMDKKGKGFASTLGSGIKTAAKWGAGIAAAAGAAVTGVVALADSTAQAGDRVDKMSQSLGLSNKAFQEWDYVLGQNGASVDNLKIGMKNMATGIESGNKTVQAAFSQMGIAIDKNMSREEAFNKAVKGLQGIKDEAKKSALAYDLFGKGAGDLMPLLNQTAESTEELKQRAHELGIVMTDEAVNASVVYGDLQDDMKQAFTGIKNSMLSTLLPSISAFYGEAAGFLGNLSNDIKATGGDWGKIAELVGSALTDVVTKISEKAPEILQFGTDILLSLTNGLLTNLPAILEAVTQCILAVVNSISEQLPVLMPLAVDALMQIVQGLVNNIPMLIDAAMQLILGLANGLIAAIPVLISYLPTIITSLVDGLLEAVPQIIEAGITLLTALVEAMPEIITQIVEVLPEIIDGIINALMENLPLLIQAGIDLFMALIEALPEIIVSIAGAMPQIITSIIDALVNGIPQLIDMGVQLFIALVENLPTIIIEICKAAPQIVSGLVESFKNLASKMWDIGKNLLMGIWTGIQNAKDWLLGKIKEWAGSILDGIKGFFGIHSPSKYTAEYGRYLAEGLAVGIKDGEQYVITAVEELADNVLTGLKKALNGIDLFADRADLEYEFWEKTAGIAASDAQKDEKRLKTANKKLEAQTEAVKNAEAAYWKMVELTGEESAESQELYNDLLQAKIDLADLEAERKEIADRMSQTKADDVNAKYAEFEKLLAEGQSLKNYGYTDSQIAEWAAKTSGYTQAGQAQTQQINKTIEMTNNFYSNALTPSRVAQEEEAAMRRAALAF